MKRITVLLLCVMLALITYGQSGKAETKDIQPKDVYALVEVFDNGNKITASIDFGDGTPIMTFANEKEKMRVFESGFEPINLFIKNGWMIEKFSTLLRGAYTITFWVMTKKVNDASEVKEGMKLIKE